MTRLLRLFALVCLVFPEVGRGTELTVFAAVSLSEALTDIAPQFAETTQHTLRFNFGASGTLARQIEAGADADVFFSADERHLDSLGRAKLLLEGTRRQIVANQLVLLASRESSRHVHAFSDLASDSVRRIAVGNPATVPAGAYAKAYLGTLRLWQAVEPKIFPLEHVRAVLVAVDTGNADAGIVYRTDAKLSKSAVIVATVSIADGPHIVYPAAVLRASKSSEAARAFVAFLGTAQAQAVFARHGFLPCDDR
ncbi:molybdate ABC transporter substrate-binding protein [Opitutaceae bacterium EW11]|nr:molybdate ABC transporter substrate-binding protein [Opitutaceae bacterium EW11]